MRGLIQLQLPMVVEARKKRESNSPSFSSEAGHILHLSQSSTSSGISSPTTPTLSAQGHSRFPSSSSSLASSPPMRESIDGFGVGKRPLTEVREEPLERDGDYEMVNGFSHSPHDCNCKSWTFHAWRCSSTHPLTITIATNAEVDDLFTEAMDSNSPISEADTIPSPSHYDLTDDHHYGLDFGFAPTAKRRRADDFTLTGFTQRFGSRMPSLSHKWRHRKAGNISICTQGFPERPSRANSIRAPSQASSFVEMDTQEYPLPPTPARSASGHHGSDSPIAPIDIQRANSHDEEPDKEAHATTPLLPPMMANLPSFTKETPYQSPLQSPTVADRESIWANQTPTETPHQRSLPSPPLSTKPSVSSFHRQRALSYSNLTPTADIPPLPMVSAPDAWADSLGHANFTINPEPYLPTQFDVEVCKQLRTDWEMARRNYTKHLMRTGEHYGATSRIHKLTEEKWAGIDAEWKRNTDVCLFRTAENGYEQALSQSQSSVAEPAPLVKLPSLNGPKSEGKFPKLGDQDIVGPMEVIPSQVQQQQQQRKSNKRSFFRFLQGVFTPPNVNIFGKPLNRRTATL